MVAEWRKFFLCPLGPSVGRDFCWPLCTSQWIQHSGHLSLFIQEVASWALRFFLLRWYKQIAEEVKSNFPLLLLFSQLAIQKTEPTFFFFGCLLRIALNCKGRNPPFFFLNKDTQLIFSKKKCPRRFCFVFFLKAVSETFQTKLLLWHCVLT